MTITRGSVLPGDVGQTIPGDGVQAEEPDGVSASFEYTASTGSDATARFRVG